MTHDQTCTFDPKWCSACIMQAEARADERDKAAQRIARLEGNLDTLTISRAISAARGEQA